MQSTVVAVGTRKGLWLARSEDRQHWSVEGPQFLMREVPSLGFVPRDGGVRLLAGFRSEHWGPTVMHSDDLGATWHERPDGAAISFPDDTGAALERIWQITADPHDREVVWAGTSRTRSGAAPTAGRRSSWCVASRTTRTGRCGARASAAAPSTRSCPTRRTPPACSWP